MALRAALLAATAILAVACLVRGAFAAEARVLDTLRATQQRQLADSLRLDAQQSLAPRGTLAPSDARRLDEVHLRQRLEQQQLNQEQWLLQRQHAGEPATRALDAQQRLHDQARQLQLQRFQLEQQELMRSFRAQPLQR